MAVQNTLNFISYNSRGMNSVKTEWIRDLVTATDASFINIQEHEKKTKTIDKYLTDRLNIIKIEVINLFKFAVRNNKSSIQICDILH